MRILQLSFNSAETFKKKLYGVSMYTLGTNRILRELGDVDLYVVAPTVFYARGRPQESYISPRFGTEKVSDGIYIKYLSPFTFLKYIAGFVRYREFYMPLYNACPTLNSLGIEDSYDAIFFEFFSLINAVKKTKALKVYRSHEIYALYRGDMVKDMEREALELADVIMPPSEEDKTRLVEIYGIDEDKICPVPIPVELGEAPRREYKDKERLNAVFSGFPHRYNIEAVRFIVENAEKAPFVAFHIFGSFQREMFGRIPENVIFHGFAPEKEYKKMLMTADIAVMPLWHQSGINVRIVEYLRYGLPVVGTPWIARGYGFKQGEHFIPFDNGESFIEALEKALDGRHREGIVKNATEHARENLNAKRIAERVGKIIERSA